MSVAPTVPVRGDLLVTSFDIEACDATPGGDAEDDALNLTRGDLLREPQLLFCQHIGHRVLATPPSLARRRGDDHPSSTPPASRRPTVKLVKGFFI